MEISEWFRLAQQFEFSHVTARLLLDVVSVLLLGLVIFLRRHKRRDVLTMIFTFNIGIFVVLTAISSVQVSVGVGFGIFAILSIVRLRSASVDNIELSYLFMTLVLGLVNGFAPKLDLMLVLLNLVLLVTIFLCDVDLRRQQVRIEQIAKQTLKKMTVVLNTAVSNDAQAKEQLESRFDYNIQTVVVESVDFIQNLSKVRFYYMADSDPELQKEPKTNKDDDDDD